MEYNAGTNKYTTIGYAKGKTSTQAKRAFLNENLWKPRENVVLFAKYPVCR
jgi:hypothetical protein